MKTKKPATPKRQPIDGVGVIFFPSTTYTVRGKKVRADKVAEQLGKSVYKGGILLLPSERDAFGALLWGFRIEGGAASQVDVQRA